MFCLNSLLLTKKNIVTTPVTKASDSPSHGLIKSILYFPLLDPSFKDYIYLHKN